MRVHKTRVTHCTVLLYRQTTRKVQLRVLRTSGTIASVVVVLAGQDRSEGFRMVMRITALVVVLMMAVAIMMIMMTTMMLVMLMLTMMTTVMIMVMVIFFMVNS